MIKTDIVVIGAGAVGCAIARELSKYETNVVVDAKSDVGGDASKSNSAIIHTGYDASPGTLESQLVVAANPMYEQLTQDLDVPFKKVGAILPAITDEQFEKLPKSKRKRFKPCIRWNIKRRSAWKWNPSKSRSQEDCIFQENR